MIKVLSSNSQGNSYVIKSSTETLLLEAGIPFKNIKKELNFDLSNIIGCIYTHSHSDHSKCIKDMVNSSVDVFSAKEVNQEVIKKYNISSHRLNDIEPLKQFVLGEFSIVPFLGVHTHNNGEECPVLNYLIYHKELGKILFITDSYYVKNRFANVDHILVECNYSEDVLSTLPPFRARTIKSHMSLQTLKEMLATMDLSKTKDITLIHISHDNGEPDRFKQEIEELTNIKTYIGETGLIIE